ncbi:bifunctional enoyl-CoA hydratase/phosphate acetyltransferase [Alterinioella nitratireducens]|uniref:bifunctional enoyl-CoA hydratase/phosphate acetyltransferase n=1 Tax=Alterinioella nitratireducens TaxID=2735915 RepID=UPI004059C807
MTDHPHLARLIEAARPLPALPTAVVAPENRRSLEGALAARDAGLIAPILVGKAGLITEFARDLGASLDDIEVIDIADHPAAAARAVALVHEGRAGAVMKGHLRTHDLLEAIVHRDGGLRGPGRMSHVFVMDIRGIDRPVLITDAALNVAPDLACKASIAQNALDLAGALGIAAPKLAALSAVTVPVEAIPSSLEAEELARMAGRGEITGGLVQGPMAMDLALSADAVRVKGIDGPVAGVADILLVPDIESGNILFKALTHLAGATAAGVVVGASVPVILTSRTDGVPARVASSALACLYAARAR